MAKITQALVHDMLEVARILCTVGDRPNVQKAALRRAVSTAYYALFHALCFICADELVKWSNTSLLEPIYRSVEHKTARTKLTSPGAGKIHPDVATVGALFKSMQSERQAADYKPPMTLPASFKTPKNALALIEEVQTAIGLLEALGQKERLQLAILLIARPRAD